MLALAVGDEADIRTEHLGEGARDRRQAHLCNALALRAAEMCEQGNLGALGAQGLDRIDGGTQARVIGDEAVFHGDVEVDADKGGLAGQVAGIGKAFEAGHGISSSMPGQPGAMRQGKKKSASRPGGALERL